MRTRLLLWSAPVVVLLLVVALKLLATAFVAGRGTDAYRAGEFRRAQAQFAHLGVANVYERWIAPYNRGDALYGEKKYRSARTQFTLALPLAPAGEKCRVRGNLALAGEQVGNLAVRAKDRQGAITAYTEALRAATEGNCRSLAARRAELQQLLDLLHQKQPPSQGKKSGKSGTSAPSSNADKLKQRNQRAARNQGDTDDANPSSTPSPNPNGKPW